MWFKFLIFQKYFLEWNFKNIWWRGSCFMQILVGHRYPPSKNVILKNDLLLVFKNDIFIWIPKASVNMTTKVLRQKKVISKMTWFRYSKIALFMTPTVKDVAVRLNITQLQNYLMEGIDHTAVSDARCRRASSIWWSCACFSAKKSPVRRTFSVHHISDG